MLCLVAMYCRGKVLISQLLRCKGVFFVCVVLGRAAWRGCVQQHADNFD